MHYGCAIDTASALTNVNNLVDADVSGRDSFAFVWPIDDFITAYNSLAWLSAILPWSPGQRAASIC